jgi:hypothetical protein
MTLDASPAGAVVRPPAWLILATVALATALLLMAVTETSLVGHYLIDQGEFLSVLGLVFIAGASAALYRSGRLHASLPFVLPWLLYPVVTQGDQVIDNLSINWMRLLTHILLALIFGAPVAVIAAGLRHAAARPWGQSAFRQPWLAWMPGLRFMADGRAREGVAVFAAALIGLEMIAAHVALGTLMIATLVVMLIGSLIYGSTPERPVDDMRRARHRERQALAFCLVGLVLSTGLYLGYKYRPGAYQGSPSYLLDPSQQAAGYPFDRIPAATSPFVAPAPAVGEDVRVLLTTYATALDQLVAGYYVVDRNYTWDFHNALFVRSWPVLPNYRGVALDRITAARRTAAPADAAALPLPADDPLGALLADVRAYVAFNFERAAILERLTADFERTKAGLQHAAHIYEGEGKLVGLGLDELMRKHAGVLNADAVSGIVGPFQEISRRVHESYANRIVGF